MDSGPALGVDVGGTFTDVLLLADGELTTVKTLTTPEPSRGVLAGIELACQRAAVDPSSVARFRTATTTGVNAILEGTGATTALVTTAGFRDVLAIRRQTRPALYDLDARPPSPLVSRERRYEIDERTSTEGVDVPVDPAEIREVAGSIDADAVAVCLLHSYADPANEKRVAGILREELDVPVSASHEVLAAFREYERTATTAADATLRPVVAEYLRRLERGARSRGLPSPRVMQSNGGIADADRVRDRAVLTLLSGPAAGVIGATATARRTSDCATTQPGPDARHPTALVTFDMGGTSTDVSVVRDGSVAHTTDATVAGHPVHVPMVDVSTVGAGGGSIAWIDDGQALRVGPRSAGADPGPACYDRGGTEPTVTDATLALGYLADGASLGGGEGVRLVEERARTALRDLAAAAGLHGPVRAAAGVYRVATARMARAVRGVTTERGDDVRDMALVAFGGAGPMFACALAERLRIHRVTVPRVSGVLSAFGLLAADERHDAVRTRRTSLADADPEAIEDLYGSLRAEVRDRCRVPKSATIERAAACRYVGQSFELEVPVESPFDPDTAREDFHRIHDRAYGYRLSEPVEAVTFRTTATVPGDAPAPVHEGESLPSGRIGTRPARYDLADGAATSCETPVYDWDRLPVDATVAGPAIVEGGESTVLVRPGWDVSVDRSGSLVLSAASGDGPGDPVPDGDSPGEGPR